MKFIQTEKAPKAIGPYSQATVASDFVFCSGQIALDPKTGELAPGGAKEQTAQALKNLAAVLEAAKADFSHVVSTMIYLTEMSSFQEVNEVYAAVFGDHMPARVTVGVSALPKGALVEISCIAFLQ